MKNTQSLSAKYNVRKLDEPDVNEVLELTKKNPLFFQYCPPMATRQSILEDMKALPPRTTYEDKFYVGYFLDGKLVAVMDLILRYPNKNTAFIGFFMMNKAFQGNGIGTEIIEECETVLRGNGYLYIRLGFAKGNPQSEAFWLKNGFRRTGVEDVQERYTVVVMEKDIFIPKVIRDFLGDEPYSRNTTGMSGSEVLIFQKYVLKIQPWTIETDNEDAIVKWLGGRVPVPEILMYHVENGTAYTLMSRLDGKMLCDEEFLTSPQRLIRLAADMLRMLWAVDVTTCPLTASRLDERLKAARFNVENHLVDLENVEPETFGKGGFKDPEELLAWLEQNRPKEDIVLTHGDFCLPNLFVKEDKICGFIDLGKMGPADRWQDIAIVLRSLKSNFSGEYNGGKAYFQFEPYMLLDELGIAMDEEKNRYYKLLDELF